MTATLHPRGTLRARFEPVASDLFRKLGVGARQCDLGHDGLYLAEELVAADAGWLGSGEHPEALAILVLALMIAQRQGSTRLPLDPKGPLRTLVTDISRLAGAELDVPRVIRTIGNLTKSPRFNSVIGMRGARLPLVVEGDALYTERARWLEDRVAARLAERIEIPSMSGVEGIAARVSSQSTRPLNDEQRRAVEIALANKISVVTGGPGTGKTLVAAAIVRGFAAMEIPHIALAAQTGKAANRLTEVIGEQGVQVDPAQTLHRLLGYRTGSRSFAHHAQSPLPVGAVIVDEASMIDLELVDALLDALPASSPLVLIGDAHQLPAIDAGQVLADLAGNRSEERRSEVFVARLDKSYRQDAADPAGLAIYEAAKAINAGEPARLFSSRASSASTKLTNPTRADLEKLRRAAIEAERAADRSKLGHAPDDALHAASLLDDGSRATSALDDAPHAATSLEAGGQIPHQAGAVPHAARHRTSADVPHASAHSFGDVPHAASSLGDVPHAANTPDDPAHAARSLDEILHAANILDDIPHASGRSSGDVPHAASFPDNVPTSSPTAPLHAASDRANVPHAGAHSFGDVPHAASSLDEGQHAREHIPSSLDGVSHATGAPSFSDVPHAAGDPLTGVPHASGDAPPTKLKALATPRTPGKLMFRGVEWVDTAASPRPHDVTLAVADALWLHLDGPRALRMAERVFHFVDGKVVDHDRADLETLWKVLARGRVLTVTRTLPTGSVAINQHLHQQGLDRLSVTGRPDFVPGEPVMVTANDYQRGLFNGDQGIIVRADEGLGRHHYRAVFRQGGELRPFAIEALRDRLELAWALTIHKSQGSELDAVALLLPHDDIPLVTRELIYTGVTRARRSVVLAGAKPIIVNGGKRAAQRHSGLGERLRATVRR